MLKFTSVEAEIIKLDRILVSWKIEATDEDLSKFRFRVERSNSPGGPFEPITDELVNVFLFTDVTKQMKSKWRKFYYKISVRNVETEETTESEVADLDSKPDFFLLEIRRRHDLYLRRFVGIRAAILVAKTFGQRCADCYDPVKQRQKSSSCQTCFSTGYVGGYFSQINTLVNFSPSPELVQILETGERQPNQVNMWMNFFPRLSPRDMIVEFPEQRRWRVATVGKTERLRATSRQIATVVEINRSDVEWSVPVEKFVAPEDVFLGFRPPDGSGLL